MTALKLKIGFEKERQTDRWVRERGRVRGERQRDRQRGERKGEGEGERERERERERVRERERDSMRHLPLCRSHLQECSVHEMDMSWIILPH